MFRRGGRAAGRLAVRWMASADCRPPALRRALEALLVAMDRYRAYVCRAEPVDAEAVAVLDAGGGPGPRLLVPSDHEALEVRDLAGPVRRGAQLHRAARPSSSARFQQTCGPVMAKGIEDTAYYRWFRLAGANEVGGNPDEFGSPPTSSTVRPATLVTPGRLDDHPHDARHQALRGRPGPADAARRGRPQEWASVADRPSSWPRAHRPQLDAPTEYLLWQTLVGTWPITGRASRRYPLKAVREAKVHTAWVDGDPGYEDAGPLAFTPGPVPRPRRAAPPRRVDRPPTSRPWRERPSARS